MLTHHWAFKSECIHVRTDAIPLVHAHRGADLLSSLKCFQVTVSNMCRLNKLSSFSCKRVLIFDGSAKELWPSIESTNCCYVMSNFLMETPTYHHMSAYIYTHMYIYICIHMYAYIYTLCMHLCMLYACTQWRWCGKGMAILLGLLDVWHAYKACAYALGAYYLHVSPLL